MTPPLLSPFTLSHLCQIGRDGENEKSFREISSLITGFKEKYADFAQERLQKELSQCKTLVENLVSYKRNARSELQKLYNETDAGNSFTFADLSDESGDSEENDAAKDSSALAASNSGSGATQTAKVIVRVGDLKQEIAADKIAFQEPLPLSSAYVPIKINFRVCFVLEVLVLVLIWVFHF
jgi:hypothetical protein